MGAVVYKALWSGAQWFMWRCGLTYTSIQLARTSLNIAMSVETGLNLSVDKGDGIDHVVGANCQG